MLVDFNDEAASRSPSAAGRRRAPLSVGEIIARHQQQQRAQDAARRHYVRARADGAALPSDRRRSGLRRRHREPLLLVGRRRRVGGAVVLGERIEVGRRTGRRFRCCSPRKCCRCRCSCASTKATAIGSPAPSASTGSTVTSCKFEPVRDDSSLYRGTVWIDRRTFARIRVQAVQGGLSAPVVSNEEDPAIQRRSRRSATARCFSSRPDRAADRARGRPQSARREDAWRSATSASTTRSSIGSARRRARAIASCSARRRTGCATT